MQPTPPCPAPACWWWMRASGLLLHWQLWSGACFILFYFLPVMLPSEISKLLTDPPVRGFLLFGNFSSFTTPSPVWVSVPNSFLSPFVFYILSYFLSKRMGCLSGCLESSASIQKFFFFCFCFFLWKLLSIQMNFWWICGRESGLPVLFLCHLGLPYTLLTLFLPSLSMIVYSLGRLLTQPQTLSHSLHHCICAADCA